MESQMKYTGYIWWCEDDVCDCRQPVIESRGGDNKINRIWEGEFLSQPTPTEWIGMVIELDEAIERLEKERNIKIRKAG